jgi:hypothetical protein
MKLNLKFKSSKVKFINFETHSPILAAPLAPIRLFLINFKIEYDINFFSTQEELLLE